MHVILRKYIRDNYYSRLNQLGFIGKDYFDKKKYKVIEFQQEFQQELTFVLPFAYWHHLNGTLLKTISCKNTKDLYFFSENHEEKYDVRLWRPLSASYDVPNMTHCNTFSFSKWARVPLKEHYQNDRFRFDKPLLIIANKYNIEWDGAPINYLDYATLNQIITTYKDKYQIVYNRPSSGQIVEDNSEILDLKEHARMRQEHPEVIVMDDLYAQHKATVNSFNHLQLLLYANCSHFISVHGGTAALASYFGGTNIIFSKRGVEHYFNEFSSIFPALSGARILHAKTEKAVLRYLEEYY
ncbi:hypothetical protein [Pontibacter sp. 172403-2]|uniref:hypothetical protein n=1 Tax=Pontibacter rufus TaxID=2791028 RepID=UPI001E60CAC8|nr:hypothetical protein [Pontibacter sp. 172403-2]